MSKMKEAILKNPTPELLRAYEDIFGEKLEAELPNPNSDDKIEVPASKPITPTTHHENVGRKHRSKKHANRRFDKIGKRPMRMEPYTPPSKLNFFESKEVGKEELDAKFPIPRSPRIKPKHRKIKVMCRKCGAKERISENFPLVDIRRYVCNECSIRGA
jgi:hypothetical protein